MRWWWFGAAVVKPEILRELQQMKAAEGQNNGQRLLVYLDVHAYIAPGNLSDALQRPRNGALVGERAAFDDCNRL